MSTDLYGIRVLEVAPEQRRIRLRVFVVYYDVAGNYHQPIPTDRSFFVRVLCDRDALGDDIAPDGRFDESYIDANAFRFVDRFVELARRNDPLLSFEGMFDFYYERSGAWQDEERLVQADYDVFVTESPYLAPFTAGMSWGTTSYQTRADLLTLDDYPRVPDLSDARTFVPFPDASGEASSASKLLFSADSAHLLAVHNDGGFRVFRVADLSIVYEAMTIGDWLSDPGWTCDGRVAAQIDGQHMAFDLQTGEREPFGPFGRAASADGTRFVSASDDAPVQILDHRGAVLFELVPKPGLVVRASFDASGNRCALAVESEPLRIIDLATGTVREMDAGRVNAVAMSPDGLYLLVSTYGTGVSVRRTETGEVLRTWMPPGHGISTCAAWSPDGLLAATSFTDDQGYCSKVTLHRVGSAIWAAEREARVPPPPGNEDITDLAKLYVSRTASFAPGWASHLDDDLLDFHLTLVRMGLWCDLVPHMRSAHTQIAARAYEAVLQCGRGETMRAQDAFVDATYRLEQAGDLMYVRTFVYAPMAAAQHALGLHTQAEESLLLAREGLDQEANAFQKSAILLRALLFMGRMDEVHEIVEAVGSSPYVSQFHVRFLSDLIDAGAFELLKELYVRWRVSGQWSEREALRMMLLQRGAAQVAASLGLALDKVEEDPSDGIDPATLSREDRIGWLGRRARWDEVYAVINETRPTLRGPLYGRVAAVASMPPAHVAVVLDALGQMTCTDMNSPGLRALQQAFLTLSAPHHRAFHP